MIQVLGQFATHTVALLLYPGLVTIALSGFSGGRSAQTADINLHVAAENYGIVEDAHQSLMHIMAQYVRMSEIPSDRVAALSF